MAKTETLTGLFESFRQFGERPALIQVGGVRRRVMGYDRLYDSSRRMATMLAGMGVSKGDRVAIWAPNSAWWAVAFWGVILRGAVVVPIDFSCDSSRAAGILSHSGAGTLILSDLKAERPSGCNTLLIEELRWRLEQVEPQSRPEPVRPEDTAELIYTSGTTGDPKGVILSHRNLLANLAQVHQHLPVVNSAFRFLSLLPLSHMFEQMAGFLVPLSCGASIVNLITLKPSAIMAAFAEEDIRAVVAVPRLLQLLKGSVEAELAAKGLDRAFAHLRAIGQGRSRSFRKRIFFPVQRKFGGNFELFVSGGAALDAEVFNFWNDLGFMVLEGYGLSECGPVLAANTIERQQAGAVGPALPGVELRICGGEVQARGANVFSGYYRNPRATDEAFTADGWFRSGDAGELDECGWLRLKGRFKEMIVTASGINVFPDELESVLTRLPGVRDACVIGLDRGQGEEVHAVVIPDDSGRPVAEIVAEANGRLDALQRITGFSVWPEAEFPRTTTLKVRKFIVRERLASSRPAETAASGDRLKELIAIATSCDLTEVGEESFLVSGLGLTSIGRLELVSAIEREFRLDLDESLIGPQTTVAALREIVRKREKLTLNDHYRFWCNAPPVRMVRRLADTLLHFPLMRIFYRVEVQGLENLESLEGPVMFVSNHVSYLDQPSIMRALPPEWRYRTATAAWAEFFFLNFNSGIQKTWKRLAFEYCSWAVNIFPLPQISGFRRALLFMGRLVDNGVSVLVFPEGERTLDGRMLPFRHGLGIMAAELEVPLVPLRIKGLDQVLPRGASWPKRGRVTIVIGSPLMFKGERPDDIVRTMRQAIGEL
ncbi:MAG: AMP-binding protein [Geobacteraceae bacterium]|nr:AMP-binding protein [Geobacteraceae bacterium]